MRQLLGVVVDAIVLPILTEVLNLVVYSKGFSQGSADIHRAVSVCRGEG
jgi:hypothetical protein